MIFSPQQLDRKARFYRELGQMTDAGITLQVALKSIARHSRDSATKSAVSNMLSAIDSGESFGAALLLAKGWAPVFDVALLGAGEQSGRLPACFHKLSSYYEERSRLLRQLLASIAYPMLLVHAAILIFPVSEISKLVQEGGMFRFLSGKLLLLLPLYLVAGGLVYLAQSNRAEGIRSFIDALLNRVPVLGAARSSLAMARLCLSLEALTAAGTDVIRAWELSAAASGSPRIQRAVRSFRPSLESGQTPAELVSMSSVFPEEFAQQVHSAEVSGKMDETLGRMHRYYEDNGSRQSRMAVGLGAGIVFGVVVLAVAYQVVQFWSNYYGQINQVLEH